MGDTIQRRISALLLSNRKHARYVAVLACMALAVVLGVTAVLRQQGQAKTYEVKVLDCQYSGSGAHTHDASCYDADGNLVCPLEERTLHTHDESCYASETYLVCGQEEGEGAHWHTDECYDEEGNLVCGLEESEGHVHTDACWQTDTWLACGLEEVTEEHVHGEGCFKTVTVTEDDPEPEAEATVAATNEGDGNKDDSDKPAAEETPDLPAPAAPAKKASGESMPAQEFTGELKAIDEDGNEYVKLTVTVKAPEGAFEDGTTMRVKAVDAAAYAGKVNEAIKAKEGDNFEAKSVTAVDITFIDKSGEEVEPAKKIEVKITDDAVKDVESPTLVHVDRQNNAEVVTGTAKVNADEDDKTTGNENTIRFDADKFSPYFVTEVSEVVADAAEPEAEPEVEAESVTFEGSTDDVAVTVVAPAGAFPEGTTMTVEAIAADDVVEQVEAAVQEQAEEGAEVRVKQAVAVDIKFFDAEGNQVEPLLPVSVRMSSQAIRDIEEPVLVHVPDEADAEVVADVQMTNSTSETMVGDEDTFVFESDQFSPYVIVELETLTTRVITADGETYTIEVTFGPEAGIPEGAYLSVNEILPGDNHYDALVEESAAAVFTEVENINHIRLFDITIYSAEGSVVEPLEPVQVKISYNTPVQIEDVLAINMVHFGGEECEVIDVQTNLDENGVLDEVSFDAESFSTYAIVSTATSNLNGNKYAIVNTYTHDALQDTALSNTAMNKIRVTVNNDGRVAATGVAADKISTWEFISAGNNTYYIRNEAGQYLNLSNNALSVSNTQQAITVVAGTYYNHNGMVRLTRNSRAVNDSGSGNIQQGMISWQDDANNNDNWFHLYELGQVANPPTGITVHYVDENGNQLAADKDISQTTKADGTANYNDTYVFGDVYDLYQKIDGYAYQSTHLSTRTGTRINAEVIYCVADSYRTDNSLNYPVDGSVHSANYTWMYQQPGSTSATVSNYDLREFGNVRDVYVVYAEGTETIPSHSGGGSGDQEDLDEPKPTKTLVENGDGTYKMSLSVKASSKDIAKTHGANVILIFDRSASMGTNISDGRTRMAAAQEAARSVSTQLLGLNTTEKPNLVEMCVVPFSGSSQQASRWYSVAGTNSADNTDNSTINGYINNLRRDGAGGTNWGAALEQAYAAAQAHNDGDDTYIIFMTDGNPWLPNQTSERDAHSRDYMEKGSYINATLPARQVAQAGYEIYGIGIYGNVDVLHYVLNYAYNARSTYDPTTNAYGHYYIAQQQSELIAALSDIAGQISGKLSMAGVDFKDGIAISTVNKPDTTKTALNTVTKDGVPVLTGVTYEMQAGSTGQTQSFQVSVDSSGTATYTIGGSTGEATIVSKPYQKIVEQPTGSGTYTTQSATANVYQIVSGSNTYYMPIATLDSNGELEWDLSPLETLEADSVYTISTTVWPDQNAYDLVTDLNNGTATWVDAVAEAVTDPTTGNVIFWKGGATRDGKTYYEHIVKYNTSPATYAALSNTHQDLDYFVVDQVDDTVTYKPGPTINMPYPDGMGLLDEQISLKKEWNLEMPGSVVPSSIKLDLLRGGEVYIDDFELTASNGFATSKYISTGMMINLASANAKGITNATNQVTYVQKNGTSSTYVILNEGHDYEFVEEFDKGYQLEEKIYHPMLVDNVLKNVEVSEDGKTITEVEDITEQGLVATNVNKGGLNIYKKVLDLNNQEMTDCSEMFDAQVTLNAPRDADENLDFTNVDKEFDVDGKTVIDNSVVWYVYFKINSDGTESTTRAFDSELIQLGVLEDTGTVDSSGYPIGNGENHPADQYDIYGSGWFMIDMDDDTGVAQGTVKIIPGYVLRFTNMAAGISYTVTESNTLPVGYEYVSTDYVHIPYEDGQAQDPVPDGAEHVIVANQGHSVTVTNKQVSSDMILIKTDEDGNAITSATNTAKFKLTRNEAYDGKSESWPNAVDKNSLIVNGVVTVNSTEGVKLETLADGIYQISETAAPNGYIVSVEPAYFRLSGGNVQFVTWEKGTDPDSGETTYTITDINPPTGYTVVAKTDTTVVGIKIANTPGSELPNAGGPGTTLYTITGMALCVAAVVMYGFASRRGRERRFD